ncbi:M28 family peptidase [Bacteroidota bacterium]
MKNCILIFVLWISYLSISAQSLGLVEGKNHNDIYVLFNQKNITVHFYNDNFAIISGEYKGSLQYALLEENGFDKEFKYFVQYFNENELPKLKESISGIGEILFSNQNISIIKISEESILQFKPIKNDALVFFDENKAFISDNYQSKFNYEVSYKQEIASILDIVNTDSIEATISYLSSFTTRDCYSSEVVNALNWIKSKFESYGLRTTVQNLSSYGIPSFNVIATQPGTEGELEVKADSIEYVIVGGHADSYSNGATAPGADDNASGVAGVLEIARILSEYTFEHTIIYCAFSGEEYGLFGSNYFATDLNNNNKNVIGYVNLDMIGYKHESQTLHTSLIYPYSANDLADYYKNICSTYLPDFGVEDGYLFGGDSDHTSFNNQGYMGIFPFEDVYYYSPYIHSINDILGLSVNSLELAENLTGAALATVASLAGNTTVLSEGSNLSDHNYFMMYPNPVSSELHINYSGYQSADIELFNILGELIIKKTIEGSDNINVSNLSSGTYFVKLTSGDHTLVKKCVIKGN